MGRAMAIELSSLGINLSSAPVLDIESNRDNPVIGLRAFAHAPDLVAKRAYSFMKELESVGVRACGKHTFSDTKIRFESASSWQAPCYVPHAIGFAALRR
jgi:Glycosyl hydrolase family 3 N terminal domain